MPKLNALIALLVIALSLNACSSSHPPQSAEPLLPLNFDSAEPDSEDLADAISLYLAQSGQPTATGYDYSRIDLNTDRKRDALVMLRTPYGYWCGIHGCTMLIFKASSSSQFTLVNTIQPVRGPVYVSTLKNNGWRDIVVRVSGRSTKAKDVAMFYNGQRYPLTPANLPPFPKKNFNGYTRVLMGNYTGP